MNLVFYQRIFANANRHICFFSDAQKSAQKKQKSQFSSALSKTGFFLLILLFITSCGPQSKETYLKKYQNFITEINEESDDYSEQDWEKADEKYTKFNNDWHKKFEDELTWEEDIILAKYKFQYNLKKTKVNSNEFFHNYIKNDYEQLKEQLKYYSENEMDEDIEFLLEQAKEIGDSATKTIEGIFKELNIDINNLGNDK